jgi:hypothetical protein
MYETGIFSRRANQVADVSGSQGLHTPRMIGDGLDGQNSRTNVRAWSVAQYRWCWWTKIARRWARSSGELDVPSSSDQDRGRVCVGLYVGRGARETSSGCRETVTCAHYCKLVLTPGSLVFTERLRRPTVTFPAHATPRRVSQAAILRNIRCTCSHSSPLDWVLLSGELSRALSFTRCSVRYQAGTTSWGLPGHVGMLVDSTILLGSNVIGGGTGHRAQRPTCFGRTI